VQLCQKLKVFGPNTSMPFNVKKKTCYQGGNVIICLGHTSLLMPSLLQNVGVVH